VFLVGFDGYEQFDARHTMMQDTLRMFQQTYPAVPLIALTRSTYEVDQRSLFSPL